MKYFFSFIVVFGLLGFISVESKTPTDTSENKIKSATEIPKTSSVLDEYKGVKIYHNGSVSNVHGRNLTRDGYNLGLKWQCVEFVKRFYFETFDHKMPDSYGHAKDFFDKEVNTGWNKSRAMYQYANGSTILPREDMILVFDGSEENPFGHIAIIAEQNGNKITVVQQNWGRTTRMRLSLSREGNQYYVDHPDVLGWLSL